MHLSKLFPISQSREPAAAFREAVPHPHTSPTRSLTADLVRAILTPKLQRSSFPKDPCPTLVPVRGVARSDNGCGFARFAFAWLAERESCKPLLQLRRLPGVQKGSERTTRKNAARELFLSLQPASYDCTQDSSTCNKNF